MQQNSIINAVKLQRCPGLQFVFSSMFATDPSKITLLLFTWFFREKENSDAKMIIPTEIINQIAITLSVKLISIFIYLFFFTKLFSLNTCD